jgi:hypothetical protein
LKLALGLLDSDLEELYLRGSDHVRRLMNQSAFAAIWVEDEQIAEAEFAELFDQIRRLNRKIQQTREEVAPDRRQVDGWAMRTLAPNGVIQDKGSDPLSGWEPLDLGVITSDLVAPGGFEPPTSPL